MKNLMNLRKKFCEFPPRYIFNVLNPKWIYYLGYLSDMLTFKIFLNVTLSIAKPVITSNCWVNLKCNLKNACTGRMWQLGFRRLELHKTKCFLIINFLWKVRESCMIFTEMYWINRERYIYLYHKAEN